MIRRIVNLNEPKVAEDLRKPLVGNSSGIKGDPNKIYGNISPRARGDWSGMTGDVTGIEGDATNLKGNLDLCQITAQERQNGIDIKDLVVGG